MIVCDECGTEIAADSGRCPNCGSYTAAAEKFAVAEIGDAEFVRVPAGVPAHEARHYQAEVAEVIRRIAMATTPTPPRETADGPLYLAFLR